MYSDINKALHQRHKKLIKQGGEELEIVTEEIERLDELLNDHL